MKNLSYYYHWLFFLSGRFEIWRKVLLYTTVILLSASIYLKGYALYSAALLAFVTQTISWSFKTKIENLNSLAHDLHNIHVISMAYGKVPSQFELSHLKSKVGLWVAQKVEESQDNEQKEKGAEYKADSLENGTNKLRAMIHENSYFNHYLYKYTFERNLNRMIIAATLIIIPAALFYPLLKSSQHYDLARLIFSFLSVAILYEFLEATVRLRNASKSMLEIDNEISRHKILTDQKLLNIFSQYTHITRTVPSIPNKLYNKYSGILNEGWGERYSNML